MDDSFVFSAPPVLEKMMDMSTKDGVLNFHCKRARGFCDDSTGSAAREGAGFEISLFQFSFLVDGDPPSLLMDQEHNVLIFFMKKRSNCQTQKMVHIMGSILFEDEPMVLGSIGTQKSGFDWNPKIWVRN
ncbi:hypothetical protein ACOSP7_022465 [Xanthoceras sorbifolium]